MSLDFCFWKAGDGTPAELYDQAADGDYSQFAPSQSVSDFRSEVVARWPEIADSLEPLDYDPFAEEQADLSRCLLVTLSLGRADLAPALIELALASGLTRYDPQREMDLV
jgi:hypothetical protein